MKDIRDITVKPGKYVELKVGELGYVLSYNPPGNDSLSQKILAINSFLAELWRANRVTLPFNPDRTYQTGSISDVTLHFDTLK